MGNKLFSKEKSFTELIFVLPLFLFNLPLIFADSVGTGSISGNVIPNDTSIVVQAIQNLSIVNQTNINKDGTYSLELPPGRYGLLFVQSNGCQYIYIYKDRVNNLGVNWKNEFENLSEEIEFINLSEEEQLDGYNFDLEQEGRDYIKPCYLTLYFRNNVSQQETAIIRLTYNLTLIDEWKHGIFSSLIDIVELSPNETTLKLAWDLHMLPEINMIELEYPFSAPATIGTSTSQENNDSEESDAANNKSEIPSTELFADNSEASDNSWLFPILFVSALVLLFILLLKFGLKNEK